MSRLSKSELIKNYRRERKNYMARRRYWGKKIGFENLPPLEPNILKQGGTIRVRDISKISKQREGYFSSFVTKKIDNTVPPTLEELWSKHIPVSEVDLYYNTLLDIPEGLTYRPAKFFFNQAIEHITNTYSKEQIAYIMRANFDYVIDMLNKALIYENDYYTNPKIINLADELRIMFDRAPIPDDVSKYLTDNETAIDRDFENAGDMGEYKEDDFR